MRCEGEDFGVGELVSSSSDSLKLHNYNRVYYWTKHVVTFHFLTV